MKKFLNILFVLLIFFSLNAYSDEGYQLNTYFPIEKPKSPSITKEQPPQVKEKPSKKPKKEKNTRFNPQTNKEEEIPRGYYGKLPDIEADFNYLKQQTKTSSNMDMQIIPEDETDETSFKEAPTNDTLFLDKIIKKEPNSQYINDILKIKTALYNLQKCIEEKGTIQRFNANVNVIDLYCQNFEKKYKNTSESLKESYNDILATNYMAKTLGNLKYNANYYAKYVPVQQGQYSKENIELEEQKLLENVNRTIFSVIKEMGAE